VVPVVEIDAAEADVLAEVREIRARLGRLEARLEGRASG
jgi:hypothetical protein